ncbi:unnamed protein product [Clavelina lepadiformis]|uniref:Uncharacterized protein n=1 Tax=Clavelina lepadiformis TaxID=159417 RepID=A0ABP0H187_CLALP
MKIPTVSVLVLKKYRGTGHLYSYAKRVFSGLSVLDLQSKRDDEISIWRGDPTDVLLSTWRYSPNLSSSYAFDDGPLCAV